jgi:hypothetical protein
MLAGCLINNLAVIDYITLLKDTDHLHINGIFIAHRVIEWVDPFWEWVIISKLEQ